MNVLHVGRDVATLRSITEPKQESPLLREGTSSAKSVEEGTGPPANPVERQRILGRYERLPDVGDAAAHVNG